MTQTIYGIAAIMILALLVLHFNRATNDTEQHMMMNEVSSQISSVGTEILDLVANRPFDKAAADSFPNIIKSAGSLKQTDPINGGSCANKVKQPPYWTCPTMNEYDNKNIQVRKKLMMSKDSVLINAKVDVRYVDPTNLNKTSPGKRFAKEITVTLSSASLYATTPADTLVVKMSRIVTYPNLTTAPTTF